jgi:small nuclear ribonucleoprotein (snRNP)-like protein
MENKEKKDSESVIKLKSYLDKFWKIEIQDGRTFIGKLRCVDSGRNVVLSEATELKQIQFTTKEGGILLTKEGVKIKTENIKKEDERFVGHVIVPGKYIVRSFVDST